MIEIWVFYVNTNTLHILHGYPSVKHISIMNLKVLRVPVYFISFGTKTHTFRTIQSTDSVTSRYNECHVGFLYDKKVLL